MANTKSLELESSSSQYAYITDANQTGLDITGDISIEAWIKLETSADTVQRIVSKGDDGTSYDFSYVLFAANGGLTFNYSDNGEWSLHSTSTVTDDSVLDGKVGEWVHIAISADVSAMDVKFYINGVLVNSTLSSSVRHATSIHNSSSPFYIGCHEYSGSPIQFLDGLIEHVRVWNDVRTEAEIRQYMFQDPATNEAGLQGWWKFDDNYLDQTSNNNDLTAVNSPVFSTDTQWTDGGSGEVNIPHSVDDDTVALWHMNGIATSADKKDNAEGTSSYDLTEVNTPTSVEGFDGEANGAYELNGTDEYLSFNTETGVYGDNGTIEAWVYLDVNNVGQVIYQDRFSTSGSANLADIEMTSGGKIFCSKQGSVSPSVIGTTTVTTGEWHYIAFTYETGAPIKVYLDGVLEGVSGDNLTAPTNTASEGAKIGRHSTSSALFFNGKIDEVNFSSRTKTAEEIAKYYAGRVSAKYYNTNTNIRCQAYSNTSWDVTHDAITGNVSSSLEIFSRKGNAGATWFISRGYLSFLTSELPNATILSSSLNIYANTIYDDESDINSFISIVNGDDITTQNSLVIGDYPLIGDAVDNPTELIDSTNRLFMQDASIMNWYSFGFNSDGIEIINYSSSIRSGYTEVGIREGHDILDDTYNPSGDSTDGITFDISSNQPYLWVEYEALSDDTKDFITTCNWTSTGTYTLKAHRGSGTDIASSVSLFYRKKGDTNWIETTNGQIEINSTGEWEIGNDWNKSGDDCLTHSYNGITAIDKVTDVYFNEATLGTTVGDYFMYACWKDCTSLTVMPEGFNMPTGLTTVGNYFYRNCWDGCSSLTSMPIGFNIPSGITSVGSSFMYACWYNCTLLDDDGTTENITFPYTAIDVFGGTCPLGPDTVTVSGTPVNVAMNRPEPELTDNLVSYWKFDGNAIDAVGDNDLTLVNSPSYVAGKINNCLDLEASSSQYATITNAAQSGLNPTSAISIESWVKLESIGDGIQQSIVAKYGVGVDGERSYLCSVHRSGSTYTIYFVISQDGSNEEVHSATLSNPVGIWTHIACTWSGSSKQYKIYLNGSEIGTTKTGSYTSINDGTDDVTIGYAAAASTTYFDGLIDEVGIWNRVLSASEVAELYNSGDGLQYPFGGIEPSYYSLIMDSSSFTLTGNNIFFYSPGLHFMNLLQENGDYLLQENGDNILLEQYWHDISLGIGTFSLTGMALAFAVGKGILIEATSFALTGYGMAYTSVRNAYLAVGSFLLTGYDIVIKVGKSFRDKPKVVDFKSNIKPQNLK